MPEDDDLKKVFISRTNREWKTIDKKLNAIGKKNLPSYIMGRILLLEKQYAEDKSICNVERRKEKPIPITDKHFKIIDKISLRAGLPIATLIDRLIIDPLIMPLD